MAANSSMQVQHRCGTCDALLGSIDALSEHSKEHAVRDDSSGESDSADFTPGRFELPESRGRGAPWDAAPKPHEAVLHDWLSALSTCGTHIYPAVLVVHPATNVTMTEPQIVQRRGKPSNAIVIQLAGCTT